MNNVDVFIRGINRLLPPAGASVASVHRMLPLTSDIRVDGGLRKRTSAQCGRDHHQRPDLSDSPDYCQLPRCLIKDARVAACRARLVCGARYRRWMGLTMAERKAVTKTIATRYKRADKAGKARILDERCATTGWHRDHARKALRCALGPRVVRRRTLRPPKYGPNVVAALVFCWAVLGMPAGKRLAPMLGQLVEVLRRFGELTIDEDTAALLVAMSAATIDRRLAGERTKHQLTGRSHTKPGSLLKSQIPVRTWADWDDAVPGFVEIDLVGHEGGNAAGEHCFTLTVTDIATGWTENRSVPNKARKWVLAALEEIAAIMPFPILGVDSDNGSEFINHHLLTWCDKRKITFTRSRPGNSNDGCHVEQKNWAIVRIVVGYHRYDTQAELLLLNKIWVLQSN